MSSAPTTRPPGQYPDRTLSPTKTFGFAIEVELAAGAGRKVREIMLAAYTHPGLARRAAEKRSGFLTVIDCVPLTEAQFTKLRSSIPPTSTKGRRHQIRRERNWRDRRS